MSDWEQIENIRTAQFATCSYDEAHYIGNSLIYCDIPYQGTKQYSISKNFDYDKFWNWVREMSKKHTVLVSEYNAPNDFECIWSKTVTNSLNTTKTIRPVEKLWKLKETKWKIY